MKKKKKIKINLFNLVSLITIVICSALLIHDFIFWGVIPMFSGVTYQLTYFGLFLDVIAIGLLDLNFQLIKEW